MATEHTAVLLTDRATEQQVGLIVFAPSGMLVFRMIKKGLHVFALKPIERFLKQHGLDQPLYVKYADQMDAKQELPPEILLQESPACADAINRADPPRSVGGHTLAARVVTVTPQE